MFFKYACLSLCVISSTFFAASHDTRSERISLVRRAIQNGDVENFNNHCKDIHFLSDDIQGTMLLLYAAYTPRSKRANTHHFIKTLLGKGANPTLDARIGLQYSRIIQQDENRIKVEGSTSFYDLPTVMDAAILAGNTKAVETLCLSDVDISETNMRLGSFWQTIFQALWLDFETPLEHAEEYFFAMQTKKPIVECKATEDELFEIIEVLQYHTEKREEGSCIIS